MIHSSKIYLYAKEYVAVEMKASDKAIFNHQRSIKRDYRIIEIYKTKSEPNIKGLIKQKYIEIENHKARVLYYQHRIKMLNLIPLKRKRTFLAILKVLNRNIIREVLRGGKYVFPLNIGKLYVLVGDKKFTSTAVNWHSSMRIINSIAEKNVPELYAKFKRKELLQFEYIQLMKEHLHPTPGKPRWIVTTDSDTSWWLVFKRGNLKSQHKYFYKFKFTHYIKFKDKSLDLMKPYFNTAEEVINSTNVGFRDKVLILKRFFNEQKLNYNDISSNKW